jgi:hypothetical protein
MMIRIFRNATWARVLLAATIVAATASSWTPAKVDGAETVDAAGTRRPGFFLLQTTANGRLAPEGGPITTRIWGSDGSLPPPLLWQPDESRGDAELKTLRMEFSGRTVYGFGGLSVSCAPQWTRVYGFDVPLRVVSITRDRGTFSEVGTGSQIGLNVYGPTFYAVDPIRIVFALPSRPPIGTNYQVAGRSGPCPALVLADFQVTSVLSTRPPPSGLSCPARRIPLGLTREALTWCRGYPWEIADAATLRRESTWHYGVGLGAYSVTFSHDKVLSVDPP